MPGSAPGGGGPIPGKLNKGFIPAAAAAAIEAAADEAGGTADGVVDGVLLGVVGFPFVFGLALAALELLPFSELTLGDLPLPLWAMVVLPSFSLTIVTSLSLSRFVSVALLVEPGLELPDMSSTLGGRWCMCAA